MNMRVCAVIVTYGDRENLICDALKGLSEQTTPIDQVVIVYNRKKPYTKLMAEEFPGLKITHIIMGGNLGTAKAYSAGITKAIELAVEFIWLMDDDNKPEKRSLELAIQCLQDNTNKGSRYNTAIVCTRIMRNGKIRPIRNITTNEFLGFHIAKTFSHPSCANKYQQNKVRSEAAPYGGLLISTRLAIEIGLPREDFFLYEDDIEWTSRIEKIGGRIINCRQSKIQEIEESWWTKGKNINPIIDPKSPDAAVYYGIRNRVYMEYTTSNNKLIFYFNMAVKSTRILMDIIFHPISIFRSPNRPGIVVSAIYDGIKGNLGISTRVTYNK